MNLEGIHHITAITADAQDNVDFYAGVLGLRLVKKTVNQDQPTVYHLFFADEKGSAGSDLTFFEFPGVPPGRAGAGDVHRIVWRVGSDEALDFWEKRLAGKGIESRREGEGLVFSDPEGLEHELLVVEVDDEPLIADHPEVPAEVALRGFHAARAYSADPGGELRAARGARVRAGRTAAGKRAATAAAASTSTTSRRAERAICRAPAASTTSPGPRRSTSTRSGASGRSRPAPSRPR